MALTSISEPDRESRESSTKLLRVGSICLNPKPQTLNPKPQAPKPDDPGPKSPEPNKL